MKKLIFTMLMVLCGITAAMAQDPQITTNDDGSLSKSPVSCGARVTMTATPLDRYYFTHWSDGTKTYSKDNPNGAISCTTDADGKNTLVVNMPNTDVTFTAFFAPYQAYTIVINVVNDDDPTDTSDLTATHSNPHGDGTYDVPDALPTITASAEASSCYEFSHWTCDQEGYITDENKNLSSIIFANGNYTFVAPNVYTFTAHFKVKHHTITIKSNNTNQGTVSFQ